MSHSWGSILSFNCEDQNPYSTALTALRSIGGIMLCMHTVVVLLLLVTIMIAIELS